MLNLQKFYPAFILTQMAATPFIVLAADPSKVNSLILQTEGTLKFVIGLLFVIATIIFLWGVIQFVASAGDEKKRTEGKSKIVWGIIGLAVMAGAWGVVNIIVDYFGVEGQTPNVIVPIPRAR